MLSVTNAEGRRMSMRGQSMTRAAPPSESRPSVTNAGGNGGRKLRAQVMSVEPARPDTGGTDGDSVDMMGASQQKKRKPPKTMDELDKRIEEDELALLNMKREIKEQQKLEVVKVQKSLMKVKKEYDNIHASNRALDKKLAELMDRMKTYKAVDDAMHESSQETQATCRELTRQLATIEEMVRAEQRTMDMQTMMSKRLESDTNQVKMEAGDLTFTLDKLKVELHASQATLQVSKVELGDRENKLELMHQQAKERKKERQRRMQLMHNIISEGANNLELVHDAVEHEATIRSPRQPSADTTSGLDSPEIGSSSSGHHHHHHHHHSSHHDDWGESSIRGASPVSGEGNSNNRAPKMSGLGQRPNSVGSAMDAELPSDFAEPVDSPRMIARRLNDTEIEELVARYRTRDFRMEKLSQLEQDLKENISRQNERSQNIGAELESARQKIETLASARQVYQEVDHKNHALTEARKLYDDYKDKEYNMRVNLTALKRAVPRLLAKMTKVQHPVPSDTQLSDSLQKLAAELMKYFKEIEQAMSKEYDAEELALMQTVQSGEGAAESYSEIDKLRRMPGYARIQKELYSNMMGARPDMSANNVRIASDVQRKRLQQLEATTGDSPLPLEKVRPRGEKGPNVTVTVRKSLDDAIDVAASSSKEEKAAEGGSNGDGADAIGGNTTAAAAAAASKKAAATKKHKVKHDDGRHALLIPEPPVIDRSTAKALSALVFERDGKGVMPEKPKPKPKKKAYKMR